LPASGCKLLFTEKGAITALFRRVVSVNEAIPMKKTLVIIASTLLLALFGFTATGSVQEHGALSIGGLVRTPLHLTMNTLANFQHASVRLNEVSLGGDFHGVFSYTGVPLRFLLELAGIQRTEAFTQSR